MKITWLGQAGFLLDNGKTKIMIDPYLSNSVEKVEPQNFRRVPVNEEFLSVTPDILIDRFRIDIILWIQSICDT